MLSRALSLATVTLLIGGFAADTALAQATNLEAGKSPSQIFAGTCTACHKSPRGLLKTVPAGSLQGFLKQHYTTSPEMASLLAAFLVSNGANDPRYVGNPAKPGKDEKPGAKPSGLVEQLDRFGRRLRQGPAQEGAKPDAEPKEAARPEAAKPEAAGIEPGHHGRNAKRLGRPGETPAADGQTPDQTASERGPDGRKLSAKQNLSRRGKPGSEEPPKSDSAKSEAGKEDSAKGDAAKEETPKNETAKTEPGGTETGKIETGKTGTEKSDTAKVESGKPEGTKPEATKPEATKPPTEPTSDSGKIETPKETGSSETRATRADPVPAVTPAPGAAPAVSAADSSGKAESPAQPAPPAVAASTPPPPPVAPAGPPVPPISQ